MTQKQKNLDKNKYITLQQAAQIYGCTQKHMALMARRGRLKAIKINGDWKTTFKWLKEYSNSVVEKIGGLSKIKILAPTFKKILVSLFITILVVAFISIAYVSAKQGTLPILNKIKDYAKNLAINNIQSLNKPASSAVIETQQMLAFVFDAQSEIISREIKPIFSGIKYFFSTAAKGFIMTTKTMALGVKRVDRNINNFMDSMFTDLGNSIMNFTYKTTDSIARIPKTIGHFFAVIFRTLYSFAPFNFFGFFAPETSQQTVLSVHDLYHKLKDLRELVEGKTIVIGEKTQQIVQQTTIIKLIERETAIIKDKDLLDAELALFRSSILNQIASDMTNLESKIGQTLVVQNNYYYSEAAKTGGFNVSNNEVDFNENIDMMKNLSVLGTITGGTINGGTISDGTATLTGGAFTGLLSLTSVLGTFTHASVSDDLTIGDVFLARDGLVSISDDFYVGNDMFFADISDNAIYSSASYNSSGAFILDNAASVSGQIILGRSPTLANSFTPWPTGTSNVLDSTLLINPSSAVGDSNLLGLAVNDAVKFLVDAEGDIYGTNLILSGSTTTGATTIAGNLAVQGSIVLGDSSSDTLVVNATINDSLISNYGLNLGTTLHVGSIASNSYTFSVDGTASISGQCVTGDSLLPLVTEIKNEIVLTQIKDVKVGDYVLSLDEKTGKLVPAHINALLDMGIKPIYKITTEDGKTIRTTGNHPYLTRKFLPDFATTKSLRAGETLSFFGATNSNRGNSDYACENQNCYCEVKNDIHNLFVSILGNNINNNRCDERQNCSDKIEGHQIHNSFTFLINDKLNDHINNEIINPTIADGTLMELMSGNTNGKTVEAKNTSPKLPNISDNCFNCESLNILQSNNILQENDLSSSVWTKVIYLQVGDEIAVATDYLNGINFVKIARIEILPAEQVYDIEVEGTHNFVANGIIAHNTYITGDLNLTHASISDDLTIGSDDISFINGVASISSTLWVGDEFTVASGMDIGGGDLYVDAADGRVGIGTTSPDYTLEVDGTASISGQCVTGDTILPIIRQNEISQPAVDEINGNKQSSTAKYNSNDIIFKQIKDVKEGDYVLSLDEKTGKLVPAKINALLDMGVKTIYKITTEDGKTIRTTGNHPYLAYRQAGLARNQKAIAENYDFLMAMEVGEFASPDSWMINQSPRYATPIAFSLYQNLADSTIFDNQKTISNEMALESSNIVRDSGLSSNYQYIRNKSLVKSPVDNSAKWIKVAELNEGDEIAVVESEISATKKSVNNDGYWGLQNNPIDPGLSPIFSIAKINTLSSVAVDNSLRNWIRGDLHPGNPWRQPRISDYPGPSSSLSYQESEDETSDIVFEKIVSIEILPAEQVYDIEVEGTHNFVANGIIAHNTYLNAVSVASDFSGVHASISDDLTIGSDDISFIGGVASISSTLWVGGTLTGAGTINAVTLTEGGIAVLNNDEMDASSELLAIFDDETGTGYIVFSNNPTFTGASFSDDLSLGATGVYFSQDGDGALTIAGRGDGSDEDLTINFDDVANTIDFGTNTGVTTIDFNDFNITAAHASISDDLTIGDNVTFSDSLASVSGNFLVGGNVGIGTTSPDYTLEVDGTASISGQCITGDSLLPIVKDVGRATSYIEMVQIKDVQAGDHVLSLNEKTGKLVPAKINALLDMGIKPIYKITTEDGKTIRTTGNHPYLSKIKNLVNNEVIEGVTWNVIPSLSTNQQTIVDNLFFLFGNQSNKSNSNDNQSAKNVNISHNCIGVHNNYSLTNENDNHQQVADKINPQNTNGQLNDFSNNGPINIEAKNICAMSRQISDNVLNLTRDNIQNNYTIKENNSVKSTWTKVVYLNEGDEIAVANLDDVGRATSYIEFEKIVSIEILPPEQVYDIEVEGTHNFVANGIIAHNTYLNTVSVAGDFEGVHASISDDLTIGSDDISFIGGVASISSTLWVGGTLTGAGTINAVTLTEGGIAVLNNDEMDASSELLAIFDDETGTGYIVFSNNPTFTGASFSDDLSLGATGVYFSQDGDGALTIAGRGDGSDEDLTINFDDVANTIDFGTNTGVTTIDFNDFNITAAHASISDDLTIGDNVTFSDSLASVSGNFLVGGNVGIGTTNPGYPLVVSRAGTGTLVVEGIGSPYTSTITLAAGVSSPGTAQAVFSAIGTTGEVRIGAVGTNYWTTLYSNNAEAMRILTNGNVGIGTTNPLYQLQLSLDTAAKSTTEHWTVPSDSRLKQNISPFVDGLEIIQQINPVSYELNGLAGTPLGAKGIGVIAQDIKDVAPYTTSTFKTKLNPTDIEETELYNFNGSALSFVMINAIKELSSSTSEQQIEIEGIKASLSAIFNNNGGMGAEIEVSHSLLPGTSLNELTIGLIDQIKQILADLGIIIENGVAKIQKIIAGFIQTNGLEIGSQETPTGFVLYDKATKEPYCVSIINGEIVKTQGKCEVPVIIPSESLPVVEIVSESVPIVEEITPVPVEETPIIEPISEPIIEPVVEPIIEPIIP